MSVPSGHGSEFWAYVLDAVTHLDQRSYYQLLDVPEHADQETITRAYYDMASRLHPDRHMRESQERQRALTRLYARMGEAYRKLRSMDTRRAYDAALARGNARLSRDLEERARRSANALDPRTPKGRALYKRGRELLERGDRRGANAQWRLAIQFEPDSRVLRTALQELSGGAHASASPKGDVGGSVVTSTSPQGEPRRARGTDPARDPMDQDHDALLLRVRDPGQYPGLCDEIARSLERAPRDRRLRALWYASLSFLAKNESRTRDASLHRQTALAFDPECPAFKRVKSI